MIIKSFGEFWSPDLVDWGRQGPGGKASLLGEFGTKKHPTSVNVWEQQAIYVLYSDWKVAYIGQAAGTAGSGTLGSRLKTHYLSDEKAGRWDRFSWYGVRGVNRNGELAVGFKTNRGIGAKTMLETLEAIAIEVAQSPLNRRKERFPNAERVRQAGGETPRPTSSYLAQILRELEQLKADLNGQAKE